MGQTFRGIWAAAPGHGKTTNLGSLIRNWPRKGIIVDPENELPKPERFQALYVRTELDQGIITEKAADLEPGDLLVIDEVHKYFSTSDKPSNSILMELLDEARNHGLSFALATKQCTLLPTCLRTLTSHIIVHPTNDTSGADWISRAGFDGHLPHLPWGEFYVIAGGKIERRTIREIVDIARGAVVL